MLEIQKYLMEGNSPSSLESLGIYSYCHPSLPLIGFKYNQIEAPRQHPIVREARGIVLELNSWKLVAKPFNRFFNIGEYPEEMANFDWNNFTCSTKEDGSLILLYYYNSEWHVNTSGSFGLGSVNRSEKTWRELFWSAAKNLRREELYKPYTYVLELCTPENKVVRQYTRPSIYLLSVFDSRDGYELGEEGSDAWADMLGVIRPRRWHFKDKEQLISELDTISSSDPSFEGFVIRDKNNMRWKCKTSTYCALHHMKDNGNIILPERLTKIVLKGEKEEVKVLMPEISSALNEVNEALEKEFDSIKKLWEDSKSITNQKDFAMAVKDHRFSSILFQARKNSSSIDKLWRENPKMVAEKLFGRRTFEFDILM